MNKELLIELPIGKIKFAGIPRCWDDLSHNALEITLPGYPPLYGEWRESFGAKEIDFDVEIVSFGYPDERNLANPYPNAPLDLSVDLGDIP